MAAPLACLYWPDAPELAERLLRRHSPSVVRATQALAESSVAAEHVFLLDASGLVGLYASQAHWARKLLEAVCRAGGTGARLVLGHHAHALLLLLRAPLRGPAYVFESARDERRALDALPLAALALPSQALRLARAMALQRLGEVLRLPPAELEARLGPLLATLARQLCRPGPKLAYGAPPAPCVRHWHADEPCHDAMQLLFVGQSLLAGLVDEARTQRRQLASVAFVLHFARAKNDAARPARMRRVLHAARPSVDVRLWTSLLRLWLERLQLAWPVVQLTAAGALAAPRWQQAALWPAAGKRDVARAHEALARVRATFGEGAVVRAELRAAHLPEARFVWTAVDADLPLVSEARGAIVPKLAADPLGLGRWPRVRRAWSVPRPLEASWVRRLRQLPRGNPLTFWEQAAEGFVGEGGEGGEGALAANVAGALPAFWAGPVAYNHGWWQAPDDRDYVYASFGGSFGPSLWWLYYARQQRRWFCHGTVD